MKQNTELDQFGKEISKMLDSDLIMKEETIKDVQKLLAEDEDFI